MAAGPEFPEVEDFALGPHEAFPFLDPDDLHLVLRPLKCNDQKGSFWYDMMVDMKRPIITGRFGGL